MELGISPIITSGLVMQLLAGTNNNMRRLHPCYALDVTITTLRNYVYYYITDDDDDDVYIL